VHLVTGIAYLLGVLQVPRSLPAARVVTTMMVRPSSSGSGGMEPPSKRDRPSSFLPVSSLYAHSVVRWFTPLSLSCSYSDFKRWCWGGRSRTSSALIIRQPTVHLVTSPYFPLVASFAVSMSDLAMVPTGSSPPVVVPQETPALEEPTLEALAQEMSSADATSLGAASVEVDGVGPSQAMTPEARCGIW
jgi:hypothetical protein